MITPVEIQNKTFDSKMRGYDREEVDTFLKEIAHDYQQLYRENVELKDKLNILNESIQHYRKIEDTLHNTLIIAEKTAEETRKNAYEKAQLILSEAEQASNALIQRENAKVSAKKREIEELENEYEMFKIKFNGLLSAQLQLLQQLELKVGKESNKEASSTTVDVEA